jgi:hypothetical protein
MKALGEKVPAIAMPKYRQEKDAAKAPRAGLSAFALGKAGAVA